MFQVLRAEIRDPTEQRISPAVAQDEAATTTEKQPIRRGEEQRNTSGPALCAIGSGLSDRLSTQFAQVQSAVPHLSGARSCSAWTLLQPGINLWSGQSDVGRSTDDPLFRRSLAAHRIVA
jgi:hypothetical protein